MILDISIIIDQTLPSGKFLEIFSFLPAFPELSPPNKTFLIFLSILSLNKINYKGKMGDMFILSIFLVCMLWLTEGCMLNGADTGLEIDIS